MGKLAKKMKPNETVIAVLNRLAKALLSQNLRAWACCNYIIITVANLQLFEVFEQLGTSFGKMLCQVGHVGFLGLSRYKTYFTDGRVVVSVGLDSLLAIMP